MADSFGDGLNHWRSPWLYGVGVTVLEFDDFYLEHYPRVVGSLRLAVGDLDEAEDAAQEAFAKAMLRWRSVSAMTRPATWVYVVAVRDLRRRDRRRHQPPIAREDPERPLGSSDHADAVANAAALVHALEALPPRQRLAVALRFHGDLTLREVSRAMGCTEGTVKSTLHAALQSLRIKLAGDDLEGVPDGR